MRRTLNSVLLLYIIMAIPSYELVIDLWQSDRYYAQMMHTSGVVSIFLLGLSLTVTPALMLVKHLPISIALGRWLLPRRRHFGLGSFYYASLHLVHYIRQVDDLEVVAYEALDYELTIGWLAFLIFAALALTSNNASQKYLKTKWKHLHRLTYLGTALTFAHWLLFDFFLDQALTWLAVLVVIKATHIAIYHNRKTA
ncbi:MAG: hypothetical protein JKX71_04745 [Amylibacter sp.]|nr:hypothetical protein [Amylibacter sp.]